MIKKITAMVALLLTVNVIGMVPAFAVPAPSCTYSGSGHSVDIDLDGGDVTIQIDEDGKFSCDVTDSDPYSAVEEIAVEGSGELIVLLDDADNGVADWSDIEDFDIEDLEGTLTLDGSSVERGDLDVVVDENTVSFNGTTADFDDRNLDLINFYDGDDSDLLDASSTDVEIYAEIDRGGYDVVKGGSSNDTVEVGSNQDRAVTVYGNAGNDDLTDVGDEACMKFYGGSGNDLLETDGDDCDTAFPGTGNDTVDAPIVSYLDVAGAVSITDEGSRSTTGLAAGYDDFDSAPDMFIGSNYGDTIVAKATGDATILAMGGNDTVRSFNSNKVYGGTGDDLLVGSNYVTNYFYGNAGNDSLRGRSGNDYLFGGKGFDTVVGGFNTDVCDGEAVRSCEYIR